MNGIVLNRLSFTGPEARIAELVLQQGLNVLYGASNTGKSFVLKSLDFMLGSSRELPGINERRKYESAWLDLTLPKSGPTILVRALAGGAFDLAPVPHNVVTPTAGHNRRQLSARHDPSNTDNLSQFLLQELDLPSKSIAVDANGKKRSLSFRDIARYCVVDETSIQSEISPVESGQYQSITAERSVFKLLLTGIDDSAIVPVTDRKTFRASTAGKIEVLEEMITGISEELESDYPNSSQLPDQYARLEDTWALAQREFQLAQDSIRSRLKMKREIAEKISALQERRAEIEINFGRFEQLRDVYTSDVKRLEAIEEAGFLLTLTGDKPCPLCGAPPGAQEHEHGTAEIGRAREAARAEIFKIQRQALDLEATLKDLDAEGATVIQRLTALYDTLERIEAEIDQLAPAAESAKQRVEDAQSVRDKVRKGLSLIEQQRSLIVRRDELAALKPATRAEKPKLGITSATAHDFAQVVSGVLSEWKFPGKRHVTFDDSTYDLRIDGKHRRDNGKGVRAITHAAFKVAMLLYCRERKLPHPGFLVLDTPLLTYRDPIMSKQGPLTTDERELSQTSLKDYFFQHLSKNAGDSQFLIIENVDLPTSISQLGNVETFTGRAGIGRQGLFYAT